ncbi:hypothetical protein MTX37_14995, partial [Rhodococcus sp. ARC_M8]|uniref:hypothetical protein n=1 Tax=Rhodococcus sp. ARC_M8 TaxID=2928853 RepID=UPI001FB339B2
SSLCPLQGGCERSLEESRGGRVHVQHRDDLGDRATPLSGTQLQKASRRGENWVRGAANTGALKALPRQTGQWFRFLEEDVIDWILRGSPEFPPHARKRR